MSSVNQTWTVISILNTTSDYFSKHAIENPRLNAERLLAHVLHSDRLQLYLQFDRILDTREVDRYRALVRRRADHEPLQYLTGETEFMGLPFRVGPSVLIPRPETEVLVDAVLELKPAFGGRTPVVWDVGTGSGCIAVSLARLWPGLQVIASDISGEALALAEENARLNGVGEAITFVRHDVFAPERVDSGGIDLIVSNPPYISRAEMPDLPRDVREYEPAQALTDGGDGLAFYRRILELAGIYPGCRFILLELSASQPDAIINLLNGFALKGSSVIRDLGGHERVLKMEL